jgi:HK97 gp10 family phage protein
MVKLKLKVTYNSQDLLNSVKAEVAKDLTTTSKIILEELKDVTPKDTGEASRSWEVIELDKDSFKIINDEEYIKYLNAGTSKQAPAHFIERVVLKHGTAKGNVVDYDN